MMGPTSVVPYKNVVDIPDVGVRYVLIGAAHYWKGREQPTISVSLKKERRLTHAPSSNFLQSRKPKVSFRGLMGKLLGADEGSDGPIINGDHELLWTTYGTSVTDPWTSGSYKDRLAHPSRRTWWDGRPTEEEMVLDESAFSTLTDTFDIFVAEMLDTESI